MVARRDLHQTARGSGAVRGTPRCFHKLALTCQRLLKHRSGVHKQKFVRARRESTQYPVTLDLDLVGVWTIEHRKLRRANPQLNSRARLSTRAVLCAKVLDLHGFRFNRLASHKWVRRQEPRIDVPVGVKDPCINVQAEQCTLFAVYAVSDHCMRSCKARTWSCYIRGQIVPVRRLHPVFPSGRVAPALRTLWIHLSVVTVFVELLRNRC